MLLLLVLACWLVGGSAFAQTTGDPAEGEGAATAADTPKVEKAGQEGAGQARSGERIRHEPGVGNIIELEEEVIEGRIQKPEAFYILQRSNLNYKSLDLERSFVPNIVKSVKKAPF